MDTITKIELSQEEYQLLMDTLENSQDSGIAGQGWKSTELIALVEKLEVGMKDGSFLFNAKHPKKIEENNMKANDAINANREANRVKAIAEAMDVIRTLNSDKKLFSVRFRSDRISFMVMGTIREELASIYKVSYTSLSTFFSIHW